MCIIFTYNLSPIDDLDYRYIFYISNVSEKKMHLSNWKKIKYFIIHLQILLYIFLF